MADSLLRYPSRGTDIQGSWAAPLITNGHICGDDNSPSLEKNNQGQIPAHCESAEKLNGRGQSYLAHFIFIQSAPSLPTLLHRLQPSDCGDSMRFPPTARRAVGIRRHLRVSGLLIACSAATSLTSPLPYPPMFLLSDQWDLTCKLWLAAPLGIWKS